MQVTVVPDTMVGRPAFEVIERKGRGHPDTLSDALAEALSQRYSQWCQVHVGAVLHHNFDKVGLLGGRSRVTFGHGRLTSPIRVLLNGRATRTMGGTAIPIEDILIETSRAFMAERFPTIDTNTDLVFFDNLSTGPSPGAVDSGEAAGTREHWFAPRSLADLRERDDLRSNDTSVGCGYWPLSMAEAAVLTIERRLTGAEEWRNRSWIGSDIKVMAVRQGEDLDLTLCIPQIADAVDGVTLYQAHLEEVSRAIERWVEELAPDLRCRLWLNTKDDLDRPELYLTAIGSAIETGDEGLVGRGNRVNGLISMNRPYSMEGACGKNPVYHVGKLYSLLAFRLAELVGQRFDANVEAWMVGQEGRRLDDPWHVLISADCKLTQIELLPAIDECLAGLPELTEALISGKIEAF